MSRAATLSLATAIAVLAGGVRASAASAIEDRYGPPHPVAPAAGEAAATASTGFLSWAGKTAAPAAPAPAPSSAWTAPMSAPVARNDRIAALPRSLYGGAPPARAAAASPQRWSPPAAPAAVVPAVQPQVQAQGYHPPHFYSVARQYGVQPDPIPLSQQFFAPSSPDLAAPPPPLPPHPVPGTQAATSPLNTAANRARQVELETADSAAN